VGHRLAVDESVRTVDVKIICTGVFTVYAIVKDASFEAVIIVIAPLA
jgi:hypothetical protein